MCVCVCVCVCVHITPFLSSELSPFEPVWLNSSGWIWQDLAERDAFAERLRLKDLEKTKTLRDPDALATEERRKEQERLLDADGNEAQLLDELRKVSRRKYLEKRETQKLEEARDDVRDEDFLFGDVELTAREKRDRELKQKLYTLANERVNISDKVDRYQMPEAYDEEGQAKQPKKSKGLCTQKSLHTHTFDILPISLASYVTLVHLLIPRWIR